MLELQRARGSPSTGAPCRRGRSTPGRAGRGPRSGAPAVTTVPLGAPSIASSSCALVGGVGAGEMAAGRPKRGHVSARQGDLVAEVQAAGRRAALPRFTASARLPVGVLVEDQLSGGRRRRRSSVNTASCVGTPRPPRQRAGRAAAPFAAGGCRPGRGRVAVPVDRDHVGHDASGARSRARSATAGPASRGRSHRPPPRGRRPGRRWAATGREDVAAVEGRRDGLEPKRRERDVHRRDAPRPSGRSPATGDRCPGRPAPGPRSPREPRRRAARCPTSGSTTARCTPAGANGSALASTAAPHARSRGGGSRGSGRSRRHRARSARSRHGRHPRTRPRTRSRRGR